MKKLLHIIFIIAIASLCFLDICCSNFSKLNQQLINEKSSTENIVTYFSNNNTHSLAVGEIFQSNLTLTPFSFRICSFVGSYTSSKSADLFNMYIYLNNIYFDIHIVYKLKTTDIIFPFHDFW